MGRPILGRKGIGKFAGFGISKVISVESVSGDTGERTLFDLDLGSIRGTSYLNPEGAEIGVAEYQPPNKERRVKHGTVVTLGSLTIGKRPSVPVFSRSLTRRFLLHQQQADFEVRVNGELLPEAFDAAGIEYAFPRDYSVDEKPASLIEVDDDGWGKETLASGRIIRWRFLFLKGTIDEEELRGVSVFARGKLAQSPFLFNLTGGLGGQHGVAYLTGQVQADFLDEMPDDLIATERQRVNWDNEESLPLLNWGQDRVKKLLATWRDRRGASRAEKLEEKLMGFSGRLESLPSTEGKTVRRALRRLAEIPTLSETQFEDLGSSILTTWEQGRLKELIGEVANADTMDEERLLQILVEGDILSALNMAEAVKTKLLTVGGLKVRIEQRELENAVRDYISGNPWLLSPEWDTFRVEKSVKSLMKEASGKAGLKGPDWKGRVDLALSSGEQLLIVEFMRPGLKLDWDHLERYERYIRYLRTNVDANTGGRFASVTGYIVADRIEADAAVLSKVKSLQTERMYALDWQSLFGRALAAWEEFLTSLSHREPRDERLKVLVNFLGGDEPEDRG